MSEENVAIVRRAFDLAARRDPRVDDVYHPDVEMDFSEFFRQWVGAFEGFRFEVLECIDAGHAIVIHQRQWGRGKGSGAATSGDFWQVWLFFEGKVVRFTQTADRRQAFEAAGLP